MLILMSSICVRCNICFWNYNVAVLWVYGVRSNNFVVCLILNEFFHLIHEVVVWSPLSVWVMSHNFILILSWIFLG